MKLLRKHIHLDISNTYKYKKINIERELTDARAVCLQSISPILNLSTEAAQITFTLFYEIIIQKSQRPNQQPLTHNLRLFV